MSARLQGKRVLITQADDFMGPDTIALFAEEGAEIIADTRDLRSAGAADALLKEVGAIDILIANLAAPVRNASVLDIDDERWAEKFDVMVSGLHRLIRATLPQMIARKRGKIVVYGSTTGMRGMGGVADYCAARAAQIGYVKAAGIEAAKHNVQINLIAQNFVENPEYYPPKVQANPKFQEQLAREVPAGRLATGREDALFALFLASQESDFFVGQAIPFSGGWVQ